MADSEHAQEHDHQAVPSDLTLRVKALESLLVEKRLVDPAALDALVDTMEHKVGPRNGARVGRHCRHISWGWLSFNSWWLSQPGESAKWHFDRLSVREAGSIDGRVS